MDAPVPTITIVTPSFNQGRFIETTINSVISQEGEFYIDYIVMDGGSTDGTVDILKKYDDLIASRGLLIKCNGVRFRWWSARDNGQYDAINRGFATSNGQIMGWINSDDMYLPGAFKTVAMVFERFPETNWVTANATRIDKNGLITDVETSALFPRELVAKGVFNGRAAPFIQQESTFWRRSLWDQMDEKLRASYRYAADFDLWRRFAALTDLVKIRTQLGAFRNHCDQKTSDLSGYNQEVDSMVKVSLADKISMKITKVLSKMYLLERVSLMHRSAVTVYYSHRENDWLLKRVRGRVL
ncbi:MAG TPA: glycosyltransferase family 2 protein [Geomonas sp.]|nr:glycosyltransferase family 2 protein [Geomonas sp.]